MTYETQPSRGGNAVLKILVAGTVVLVAYWAATGGFDRIEVNPAATVTSSTLSE